MLVETGKKIFYLSPDTGKESGNISTPELPQLEISTRGVNMVANPRSGTCQKDLENSVNMLRSD